MKTIAVLLLLSLLGCGAKKDEKIPCKCYSRTKHIGMVKKGYKCYDVYLNEARIIEDGMCIEDVTYDYIEAPCFMNGGKY